MSFTYSEYGGDEGASRFAEIAKDFTFNHPNLGTVSFPDSFVSAYVADVEGADAYFAIDRIYFVAPFETGSVTCMFDGIFAPAQIE